MPEGILIIFNLATLKLSEIDNISVKNVKHVKSPVNLLFPVEGVAEPLNSKSLRIDYSRQTLKLSDSDRIFGSREFKI